MKQSIKIGRNTSGRITVAFSYNPVYIEKVKAIKVTNGTQRKTLEFPLFRNYLRENFIGF